MSYVVKKIGNAIEGIIKNPVGAIVNIGLMSMGVPPIFAGAIGGAAGAAASGGDILKGALLGGAGGFVGGQAAALTGSTNPLIQAAASGAATGALGAAVSGQNILEGALTGGVTGAGLSYSGIPQALTKFIQPIAGQIAPTILEAYNNVAGGVNYVLSNGAQVALDAAGSVIDSIPSYDSRIAQFVAGSNYTPGMTAEQAMGDYGEQTFAGYNNREIVQQLNDAGFEWNNGENISDALTRYEIKQNDPTAEVDMDAVTSARNFGVAYQPGMTIDDAFAASTAKQYGVDYELGDTFDDILNKYTSNQTQATIPTVDDSVRNAAAVNGVEYKPGMTFDDIIQSVSAKNQGYSYDTYEPVTGSVAPNMAEINAKMFGVEYKPGMTTDDVWEQVVAKNQGPSISAPTATTQTPTTTPGYTYDTYEPFNATEAFAKQVGVTYTPGMTTDDVMSQVIARSQASTTTPTVSTPGFTYDTYEPPNMAEMDAKMFGVEYKPGMTKDDVWAEVVARSEAQSAPTTNVPAGGTPTTSTPGFTYDTYEPPNMAEINAKMFGVPYTPGMTQDDVWAQVVARSQGPATSDVIVGSPLANQPSTGQTTTDYTYDTYEAPDIQTLINNSIADGVRNMAKMNNITYTDGMTSQDVMNQIIARSNNQFSTQTFDDGSTLTTGVNGQVIGSTPATDPTINGALGSMNIATNDNTSFVQTAARNAGITYTPGMTYQDVINQQQAAAIANGVRIAAQANGVEYKPGMTMNDVIKAINDKFNPPTSQVTSGVTGQITNNGNGTSTQIFDDGSSLTIDNNTGGVITSTNNNGVTTGVTGQITNNGNGTSTQVFDDGSTLTTNNTTGAVVSSTNNNGVTTGVTGNSVDNGNGTSTITYDDGSTITTNNTTGAVVSSTNTNGVTTGVTGNAVDNGDGTSTITYDDGSTITINNTTGDVTNVTNTTDTTKSTGGTTDTTNTVNTNNVIGSTVATTGTTGTTNQPSTQNWYAGQSPWKWGTPPTINRPGLNPGLRAGVANPSFSFGAPLQPVAPSAVGGTMKLDIPQFVNQTIGPVTQQVGGQFVPSGPVAPATYIG